MDPAGTIHLHRGSQKVWVGGWAAWNLRTLKKHLVQCKLFPMRQNRGKGVEIYLLQIPETMVPSPKAGCKVTFLWGFGLLRDDGDASIKSLQEELEKVCSPTLCRRGPPALYNAPEALLLFAKVLRENQIKSNCL